MWTVCSVFIRKTDVTLRVYFTLLRASVFPCIYVNHLVFNAQKIVNINDNQLIRFAFDMIFFPFAHFVFNAQKI